MHQIYIILVFPFPDKEEEKMKRVAMFCWLTHLNDLGRGLLNSYRGYLFVGYETAFFAPEGCHSGLNVSSEPGPYRWESKQRLG